MGSRTLPLLAGVMRGGYPCVMLSPPPGDGGAGGDVKLPRNVMIGGMNGVSLDVSP